MGVTLLLCDYTPVESSFGVEVLVEILGLNYIWINNLIRKFLIMLNANMAINGEISIPMLNEERRFLIGANMGSVILYRSWTYWLLAL